MLPSVWQKSAKNNIKANIFNKIEKTKLPKSPKLKQSLYIELKL